MEKASTVVVQRADLPEVVSVKTQRWYMNVLVRAGRTFLQSFIALGSILLVGSLVVDASNWEQWLQATFLLSLGKKLLVCLLVGFVTALWSAAQNALEILKKWDVSNPELRG